MIFRHPVLLCISFFSAFVYNLMINGKRAVKLLFCMILPLTVFITAVNGLTAHYGITRLFRLANGNYICLEPIVYGAVTGISVSAVLMWFSSFNTVVSSDKIMYVLGRRLPKISLLLTMSLRFVPLYRNKLREISRAQTGLGKGVNRGKLSERLRNGCKILSILISWALEGAIETSDSMKCRGYGLKNATHYSDYFMFKSDITVITAAVICDCGVIAGAAKGAAFVIYNPYFFVNDTNALSAVTFTLYAVLCLLPCILDTVWHIRRTILTGGKKIEAD
ncbi:MAG: energy-coupling factor transporter transmembrane protein EcfT [Clostridiales bacterium]|nr:energy-coupling factor transporter transmembrane protein EcfT [Clostridiales bacterium]